MVEFWILSEAENLPDEVVGPRLMTQLCGDAALIIKHISPAQAGTATGKELIFRTLESGPWIKELSEAKGEAKQRGSY